MWPGSERGSSRALELPTSQQNAGGSSQQETLADIEHISTIAGSLASIGSLSHTQMRYVSNREKDTKIYLKTISYWNYLSPLVHQ